MKKCPFCAEQIQDDAIKCKHCGEMLNKEDRAMSSIEPAGTILCPQCNKRIVPIVTSVGGGSCSVGRRDKFYCPLCQYVIKTEGCFIATATYENADADEVRLLRKFRDEVLKQHIFGMLFIKLYYLFSPYMSKLIENSKYLKSIARKILNYIVKLIRRWRTEP